MLDRFFSRSTTAPFEMIDDGKHYAVIGVTDCGISFAVGSVDDQEAEFSIFASDIFAWNRKTGKE